MDATRDDERSEATPGGRGALYAVLASSLIGARGLSLVGPVRPDLRSVFGERPVGWDGAVEAA